MILRPLLFITTLGSVVAMTGQTVDLTGGSLRVSPGTSLRFEGPVTFSIQPGAEVVNDGLIDLGSAATLVEPAGGPITGTGTEVAQIDLDGPIGNEEPGGLGLSLTTDFPAGPVTIIRGHLPRAFPEGDPSIKRWFRIDAPSATAGMANITIAYDPTELNGLSSDAIGLFRSDALDGPWDPLASTNDPVTHLVLGSVTAPFGIYTAFDVNAPTASPSLLATNGLHVWPTLTSELLFIHSTDGTPLGPILVFDGLGRSMPLTAQSATADLVSLDVAGLAAGAYYIRVGDRAIVKFRKA
ncbi:MAG: T9SS type A sorting domain-containing protein [Flavobacteriales bacterium]